VAMAAVRPLGGTKDRKDGSLTAVPSPPSLAERLTEAQKTAEPLLQRVAGLEQAKADAIAREDGSALERIKDELGEAREAAAIARADVTALQTVIAEVERQHAEDNRVVQDQQQRAAARERYAVAQQQERELSEELDAAIAATITGLEATKRTHQHAVQLQGDIWRARTEMLQARVVLGEAPAGSQAVAPNKASILADRYPVIRELVKWSR
jgi:chromosome segregation ATPase